MGRTDAAAEIHSPLYSPATRTPVVMWRCGRFNAVSKTVDGRKVVRGFESLPLRIAEPIVEQAKDSGPARAEPKAARLQPPVGQHGQSEPRLGVSVPRLPRGRGEPVGCWREVRPELWRTCVRRAMADT